MIYLEILSLHSGIDFRYNVQMAIHRGLDFILLQDMESDSLQSPWVLKCLKKV